MVKKTDNKDKAAEISRRLIEHYGPYKERDGGPSHGGDGSPFDVLIATILSQNTTDKNSHRAFASLYTKYDTPEKLANAPEAEIAQLIKIGGLSRAESKTDQTGRTARPRRVWRHSRLRLRRRPGGRPEGAADHQGRRPQDRGLCVAILLRPGRDTRRHPRISYHQTARHRAGKCQPRGDPPRPHGRSARRRARLCPRRPGALRPGDMQSAEPAT